MNKYQVGGVIYKLLQSQKPKSDDITIEPITSMVHQPVYFKDQLVSGYQQQYHFGDPSEKLDIESIYTTPESTPESTPEVIQLSFNIPSVSSVTPPSPFVPIQVESTRVVPKVTGSQFHDMLYNAFIKTGVKENVAKFMVAQDSLETGDGKHHAGRYNYGNITKGSSWTGSTTRGGDKDKDGKKITQEFRNYDSVDQYAADKKSLLSSSRYSCSLNANTIEEYARCVKQGGYATDPNYEEKLINKYYSLYGTANA